jgi:hypothetical protein
MVNLMAIGDLIIDETMVRYFKRDDKLMKVSIVFWRRLINWRNDVIY